MKNVHGEAMDRRTEVFVMVAEELRVFFTEALGVIYPRLEDETDGDYARRVKSLAEEAAVRNEVDDA